MTDVKMASAPVQEETVRKKSKNTVFRRFLKNKLATAGMIILVIMILLAIFAPVLATHDYQAVDPIHANTPPSSEHWLGTDQYGRDLFSRMLYGARYSLAIGICSQLLAVIIGVILGSLAGYFGGFVDNLILRFTDIFQSIPSTLLAIVISQALGSGFIQTMIALAVGGVPVAIRMLRATMLTVRGQEFVEAAEAIDCGNIRTMFKHVLPNSLAPMIITTSLGIGRMIMTSAGLSYLGLGVQEPAAEWGAILSLGKSMIRYHPYQVVVPGVAIALIILSFNLMGDGLRDALDPKLRT